MQTTLSASRVIEIIDRTFRIYRENFLTFVALVSVFTIPISALSFFISESIEDTDTYSGGIFEQNTAASNNEWQQVAAIALTVISLFLNLIIVNALITYVTSENVLGRPTSIREAFMPTARRFLPLGVAVIMGSIIFSAATAFLSIASICVVPAFLFPGLFLLGLSLYFFIVPVMVLEDVGIWLGLRRALTLGKIRFWKVFGLFVGSYLIIGLVRLSWLVLSAVIVGTTFSGEDILFPNSTEASILTTILSTVATIFVAPILPIGLTLMYYDTRIRVEGLDIAMRYVDKSEPRPSDVFSPNPVTPVITSQDIFNAVMLTVGTIGLCGLFYGGIFLLVLLAGA